MEEEQKPDETPPVKPEPPPVSYCHHCDGWNEDCPHGRYVGPYIKIY